MIRLILRTVRFTRGRAIALAAGLLVAAVAFSLLTAAVDASTARIQGVVARNWRGAYDLLVLPPGPLQTRDHLVQVNYLSAATGGITLSQYDKIARMPGVGIAAPLEVVGYVLETTYIPVDMTAAAGTSGARVLTLSSRFTADQGWSAYPSQDDGYVYITPDRLRFSPPAYSERLPDGRSVRVCLGSSPSAQSSPFQRNADLNLGECWSRAGLAGQIRGYVPWSFPVLVAGIDPRAEHRLTGLGTAMTAGRYLRDGEGATAVTGTQGRIVPVIASSTSFDGDVDHVTVSLLPARAVAAVRSGSAATIARVLAGLPGSPVLRQTITGEQAWRELLSELTPAPTADQSNIAQMVGQYWTAGPVTFRSQPHGELVPEPVANPKSVWTAGLNINGLNYVPAPPAAADTGFRALSEHLELPGRGIVLSGGHGAPYIRMVGEFDPSRLAGFSGRGPGSPLASYRAPLLSGANSASVSVLRGRPLLPDGNIAGYAQQPPLLYTTLSGAQALETPAAASGDTAQLRAPIGSIRIRVSGLRGSVQAELSKIAAVGQEIRNATGLRVLVTAGASPQPVVIGLPAGAFGRPPLRLSESWTAIGVSLIVLHQVDRESLALLVLILVVCGLFLAAAALAGVRSRRAEIGILRALGWRKRQVFTMVLGEIVALGVAAGCAGAVLSVILIEALSLSVPLWRAALVLPVAAILAAASGLGASWLAARIQPAEALTAAARAPRRRGHRIRTVTGLAATGVTRTPGRSALAASALAIGVVGLTVLLAAHASFSTSIGDSDLAGLVTSVTRGTDLASALLTVALSAVAVADLTYLSLRERAAELAVLSASGWTWAQVGRLLAVEAAIISAAGAALGSLVGMEIAATAFGLSLPVVAAAVGAGLGGTVICVLATTAVLIFTANRPLSQVLAADE
jgi:putative ABC transport system permease protein